MLPMNSTMNVNTVDNHSNTQVEPERMYQNTVMSLDNLSISPTTSLVPTTDLFNLTQEWTDDYDEYIYEYDYEKSISDLPVSELVPVTIIYGLTLVLGVVGNVLVIFSIIHYRRMQTVTNTFLTSLATADLLLVLLCVPIKVS